MKSGVLSCLLLCLSLHPLLFAQDYSAVWQNHLSGSGNGSDGAREILADGEGTYILPGYIFNSETEMDASFTKIDLQGNIIWTRCWGGIGEERARGLIRTQDGGFMAPCYTSTWGAGSNDFALVKYDADFNLEGYWTYGSTGNDYCQFGGQYSNGDYALGGFRIRENGLYTMLAYRIDPEGNVVWEQEFNDETSCVCFAGLLDSEDNIVLTGSSDYLGYLECTYTVKADPDGNQLWENRQDSTLPQGGSCIAENNDGDYVIGGYGPDSACYAFFMQVDQNGATNWIQPYDDYCIRGAIFGIECLPSGEYLLTGYCGENGAHEELSTEQLRVSLADDQGVPLWTVFLGGDRQDRGFGVKSTEHGILVTGWTTSYSPYNQDMYVALLSNLSINFTATPTEGDAPLTVQFQSIPSGNVLHIIWDFDSDGSPDATDFNPSWTYVTPGLQTVSCTVDDGLFSKITTKTDFITAYDVTTPLIVSYFPQADSVLVHLVVEQEFSVVASDDAELSYAWYLDGNPIAGADAPEYVFSEDDEDVYELLVQVSDGIHIAQHAWTVVVREVANDDQTQDTGFRISLYPNPFSSDLRIAYTCPNAQPLRVDIFNCRGERVAAFTESLPQRGGSLTWNGRDSFGHSVASGVYLVRSNQGGIIRNGRVLLVK